MTTEYSKTLTEWMAGWSMASNGTLTLPAFPTVFPEASLAEAGYDAGTNLGDFTNVFYAMLHQFYAKYAALTVTKPANMTMFKSESLSPTVDGESTVTFNVQFNLSTPAGTKNVKAEA